MTAPTKPLPPHGTYARANGRPRDGIKPCPCEPCRAEDRACRKQRRYLAETGRSCNVDAAPAVAHLRMLLDAGDSLLNISRTLDYAYRPLKRLIAGQQPSLRRARAEQILALQPGVPLTGVIDAVGSMRRIQALVAARHSLRTIVAESKVSLAVLSPVINGQQKGIERKTAARIAMAYQRLGDTFGTSARSANRAAREGWALPACWDGIDIDDPAAFPDVTGHCGTLKGHRIHESRGIPFCGPCREAKAVASAEYRAARAVEHPELAA